MHRHLVLTAAALTLAAAAPSPAAAQIRIPPVRLIAGIGVVDGSPVFLASVPAGGQVIAWHHPATALQLGLETTSPVRGVDLRLSLEHSNPQLRLSGVGDNPARIGHDVYRTGVNTLTLDAAIHLPRVLDSQPYVLIGAGATHFDYKQGYYRDSNQPVVPGDRTTPALHLGLGTAWSVGRYDLFVEGSSLNYPRDAGLTSPNRKGGVGFTAGFRIPLHR
jgi:opacity protein-like surface antigen